MNTEKALEEVYDEQISPLMAKIIEICQKNKMAMVASFSLGQEKDESYFLCTSALIGDEYNPPESFITAYNTIRSKKSPMMIIKTADKNGNVKDCTVVAGL